ncbi:Aste57867_12154 [Aphanomyces stellatus]|uniref:Aste57867_12154 protein n=1 Tax=Aphanomyces stellatus TaxID=120398 RepID=A0A485KWT3_9STRA|nr:hypothetical protein As57867_012109 [Aphanomyces stellatus]VFT89008.1 Aste57867_12154 [Aphanomyces stellatus]
MHALVNAMAATLDRVCRRLETIETTLQRLSDVVRRAAVCPHQLCRPFRPGEPTTPPPSPSNAAPPTWSTTRPRVLWVHWFHGNPATPTLGPLRLLVASSIEPAVAMLLAGVVETAVARALVPSLRALDDLVEAELLAVFDDAFPAYLGLQRDGTVTRAGVAGRAYTEVLQRPCRLVAQWLHGGDDDDDTSKATPPTVNDDDDMVRLNDFPVTTCRALWRLWFHGDAAAAHNIPYRLLLPTLEAKHVQERFRRAKHVVDLIAETAVAHNVIPASSDMASFDSAALQHVFDQAFPLVFGIVGANRCPTRAGFELSTYAELERDMYVSVFDRLRRSERPTEGTAVRSYAHRSPPTTTNERAPPVESIGGRSPPPPPWTFPPAVPWRAMWVLWFHGDPAELRVGPFRFVVATSLDQASRANLEAAQTVMAVVAAEAAAPSDAAMAALSPAALVAVFDKALAVVLQVARGGRASRRGFQGLLLADAAQLPCDQAHARLVGQSPPAWPRGKKLPATTCRQLWSHWFFGDPAAGVSPFRWLVPADLGRCHDSKARLAHARTVVHALVAHVGLEDQNDVGMLAHEEAMAAFDRAFHVLMHDNPHGNLVGVGAGQVRPEKVDACLFSTVARALAASVQRKRRRHAQVGYDDDDDDASAKSTSDS